MDSVWKFFLLRHRDYPPIFLLQLSHLYVRIFSFKKRGVAWFGEQYGRQSLTNSREFTWLFTSSVLFPNLIWRFFFKEHLRGSLPIQCVFTHDHFVPMVLVLRNKCFLTMTLILTKSVGIEMNRRIATCIFFSRKTICSLTSWIMSNLAVIAYDCMTQLKCCRADPRELYVNSDYFWA